MYVKGWITVVIRLYSADSESSWLNRRSDIEENSKHVLKQIKFYPNLIWKFTGLNPRGHRFNSLGCVLVNNEMTRLSMKLRAE